MLAHRAQLIERAESERQELAGAFGVYEKPLRVVDGCLSILRALRSSPVLRIGAGIGMAALAFIQPRSIFSWVVGAQAVWRLVTRARRSS